MANIAASVKSLAHENIRLDCEPEIIRDIWKAAGPDGLIAVCKKRGLLAQYDAIVKRGNGYYRNHSTREIKRELINDLAGFHGIEYLGQLRRSHEHVYYCNAGDPYATTLVFIDNRMIVSCWGHYVENGLIFERD